MQLEVRMMLRERLVAAVLFVACSACLLAAFNGRVVLQQEQTARAAFQETSSAAADSIRKRIAEAKEPADTVFLPLRVALPVVAPPPTLVDFSIGRAQFETASTMIRYRTRSDTLFRNEQLDNPELLARGTFDLGMFVTIVAPLLLIALGFGSFTSDRDSGIARVVLAQAATPIKLLTARSLPRLALVLAPIFATAALLLAIGPQTPDRVEAAALWLGVATVSLLFWWMLILTVNSFRVTAEMAGLSLVGCWAVLVVVAPTALVSAAQTLSPPPSRFEQIAAARAVEVSATQQYENDHPELASDDLKGWLASMRKSASINAAIEEAIRPVSHAFDERLAAQQATVYRLRALSPTLVTSEALNTVAGVDYARYADFRRAVLAFLTGTKSTLLSFINRDEPMSQADVDALPSFTWKPPPTEYGFALAFLGSLTLLLGYLSWLRFGDMELD